MPIDPLKFITFNRDDLINALSLGSGNVDDVFAVELRDAVVIRKQDSVAPAGLAAYASACVTVAEVVEQYGQSEQAKRLLEIADYFAGQADEARLMCSTLPD